MERSFVLTPGEVSLPPEESLPQPAKVEESNIADIAADIFFIISITPIS